MFLNLLISICGFIMLYQCAGFMVKGSSSLARSLGVTPLVIGLTVVAFGTSAPELVVSLISAINGKSMIALGNVVGSNICNLALVLGLSALFYPIKSNEKVIKRDFPLMIGISVYLLILSIDSRISRIEGLVLFSGVIAYTLFNYFSASKKKDSQTIMDNLPIAEAMETGCISSRISQIFYIVIGISGVVLGAQLVVYAAVRIMHDLGVSEKLIGLTIVAFGTSLPELATSLVAALKKEEDISLGNIVGSNIFNLLSVIGASALVRPLTIQGGFFKSGLIIDYSAMISVSLLAWLMMKRKSIVTRRQGAVLLLFYLIYLFYLVMKG